MISAETRTQNCDQMQRQQKKGGRYARVGQGQGWVLVVGRVKSSRKKVSKSGVGQKEGMLVVEKAKKGDSRRKELAK